MKYSIDFLKGLSALVSGDYETASASLKNAALNNSEMIEAYFAAGLVFKKQGQYDRAAYVIESILRSSDLDSGTKRALNVELGKVSFDAGDYEKSARLLEMTSDTDGILIKAKALRKLGRFEEAASTYKSLAKSAKMDLNKEIGFCYFRCAENDEGSKQSKYLKTALKFIPKSRCVRMMNIDNLFRVGRKSRALSEIEKFLNDELPACMEDMMKIQEIYFDDNRLEDLMRLSLKKIHENSPNPFFYLYVVKRFLNSSNAEKANEVLSKFIDNHGVSNLVARASLDIEPNVVLEKMLEDADFYKCSNCGGTHKQYYDACPSCQSFETLKY